MATKQMTLAEAVVDAIRLSFADDPSVAMIWLPLFGIGPHRHVAEPLRREFADRVLLPTTSELGIAGIAVGAAMAGARPIVPFSMASFMFRAWDVIVQEAAVARHMSGGRTKVPVVFHALQGVLPGAGAQHVLSPQALLWHAPGLEIVLPSTPADAKGLFRRAIQSDNPTVVLNHGKLLGIEGPVDTRDYALPFGRAALRRKGSDATIVALSYQVHAALEAAETLSLEGIEVEIVDPRTLVPLDRTAILESVAKTGRLVVVDEGPLSCSAASEIAAIVAEKGFESLVAPIARVTRLDAPVAHSPALEESILPNPARIAAAVRRLLA